MSVNPEENSSAGPKVTKPTKTILYRSFEVRFPISLSPDSLATWRDFTNVCRLCGTVADFILPVFHPQAEKLDIVGKIRKYMPIKVIKSDIMPKGICGDCVGTLMSWHELVRSSRIVDFMLRRRLSAAMPPPEPRPSASAGSEVIKDGVNKRLNWNITEIKEDTKLSCNDQKEICKISFNEHSNETKVAKPDGVIIHENGKRYVWCDTCKKNVVTSSWRRHQRTHHGERRYSCHACGVAFSDSGNLARHARARHARLRPHACTDCGRAFARKTHLEDHVRSHRDARDFVCDVCGKASKSATALRMHAKTHDGPYRFQCMECGSKFKRNAELRAHVTIHTGERAHLCSCGKAFRLRSQLTAHARTHDVKPKIDEYVDASTDAPALPSERQCSKCSLMIPAKRFNNHIVKNHKSSVFRCDECHCYLDRDDLLFHINNHAFSALPEHLKAEYYKNEKAILEEEAKLDALQDIELEKLKEHFRKKEAAMREQIDKLNVDKKEDILLSDEIKEEDVAGSEDSKEGIVPLSEECKTEVVLPSEEIKEDPDTPVVGTKLAKEKRNKREGETLTEQDSDVDCSPRKRKRVNPKRNSDADPTPVKRLRKNKRAPGTKMGRRAKECEDRDDGNDGDDEINTPKASPSTKVHKAKGQSTDKSPKTSRTCPICGKQYRASSSYFYHMKYFHKRSREHECSVCNKKFGTKANLAQHASIHTGSYDLECKECGKRFKSKPSLYIHEQSHGGPKRWSCAQCGRSFRWRTHLARHVTRHAAERAHVCATCGRGFSVRCDLLRHARTHTADEFHCATCGLKFAQKRYLQVHVVKKHPEAPTPAVTRS